MSKDKQQIRVRFAPSPTGWAHLGTLRSTLYNYFFVRKNKGTFVLRIEDTDLERSKKEYEEDLVEQLKWAGLSWDEFYRQSERAKEGIYVQYLEKLLKTKKAFYCEHSKEELESEKKEQAEKKQALRHICSHQSDTGIQKREKGIIRLYSSDKKIILEDLIKGKVEFDAGLLGNISIAKNKKQPLYNFAVVVDDIEMKISHVIRGEEHLPNTPKQILLYQALNAVLPLFAHIPLILDPAGGKLSKRYGDISIKRYRGEGYLPEALVNFVALLGWNPGTEKEIFSLDELVKEFSLERVHKGGAIFNLDRLNWFNGQYIRQMDLDELTKKCLPYLPEKVDFDYAKKVVALERERMKKLSEIGETTKFFFADDLNYAPELLVWKKMTLSEVKTNLKLLEKELSEVKKFDKDTLEKEIMPLAEKYGKGELLWPLRAALTGQKASPGPFEVMAVLGKEKTLQRLKKAVNLL